MSNLSIRSCGGNRGEITVTVCRIGDFITEGRGETITINIVDSDCTRLVSANLNNLKSTNFHGIVNIKFNDTQKFSMDQSIWHDLADALYAFSLCVDIAAFDTN